MSLIANRRLIVAAFLNILLPGSGLILLRRHWSGFALSLLFALSANGAIVGWGIVPQPAGRWQPAAAAAMAGAIWILGQAWLAKQWRVCSNPDLASQLQLCHALFENALRENRLDDARGALDVALTLDDENAQTYLRLARLNAVMGRSAESQRTWKISRQQKSMKCEEQKKEKR